MTEPVAMRRDSSTGPERPEQNSSSRPPVSNRPQEVSRGHPLQRRPWRPISQEDPEPGSLVPDGLPKSSPRHRDTPPPRWRRLPDAPSNGLEERTQRRQLCPQDRSLHDSIHGQLQDPREHERMPIGPRYVLPTTQFE